MSLNPLSLFETKPSISSLSVRAEDNLHLHYRHDLPGRLEAPHGFSYHLITFFLTNNEQQITHLENCGRYEGQMNRGEFYLYPAGISGFTEWQNIDKTLHLAIEPNFLQEIVIKTESLNSDRLELLPVLKQRDRTIAKLAQLFLTEMRSEGLGSQLYLESVSSALGVYLLRNYSVFKPTFRQHKGGLSNYKLRQTIDYIQANLDKKLSLKVMAQQVDMSRYYFAAQFKQAMGTSPYQYVVEQRVAKAKKLLSQKERSLAQIALECGFASQSHFNKVFRQYVGTTPKHYRQQR